MLKKAENTTIHTHREQMIFSAWLTELFFVLTPLHIISQTSEDAQMQKSFEKYELNNPDIFSPYSVTTVFINTAKIIIPLTEVKIQIPIKMLIDALIPSRNCV